MKKFSILIAIGTLLWSVIDINSVQRPPLIALVSSDNVTKIEKISSIASVVLIVCTAVANKWGMHDLLCSLLYGILTANVISNGILWIAYKKQRAVYQLISPFILLGALFLSETSYTCADIDECKCLDCVCIKRLADFGCLGLVARECLDGYASFSEKTRVPSEND